MEIDIPKLLWTGEAEDGALLRINLVRDLPGFYDDDICPPPRPSNTFPLTIKVEKCVGADYQNPDSWVEITPAFAEYTRTVTQAFIFYLGALDRWKKRHDTGCK